MIRLFVRRPVAVSMAYLAVALLGVAAWRNIPLELLPDTRLPRLDVMASWPGASPEQVEAFLTAPMEAVIQQVVGVERVVSESYEAQGVGSARIMVEFSRSTDMDFARLDLGERLAFLEEDLPPGVRSVQVLPYIPPAFERQARRAFLRYTLTGPYTPEALRAWVEDRIAPELSRIEGVALVRVMGGRDRVVEVEMDEKKIASLGLSPGQVAARLADLELVREAGTVREGTRQWTVTLRHRVASLQQVRDAVVLSSAGRVVRVGDVAWVRDTYEELQGHYRINGRPAVAFELVKEIGANTVAVADRAKARMAELQGRLPGGTRVYLDQDESLDIRRQLTDLRYRALVSAGVIFAVLLLFLRTLSSAGVVFATIGFSVLIALNLVYLGGFSLNLLTLMGLAMGFGLMVDNAIVVLENIYRKWQGGGSPRGAAEEGASQVVLPVLASTATTLIVFVPFVYLQGELRIFYVPLGIVVGLTLAASLAVSFSFVPAVAARILKPEGASGPGRARGKAASPVYLRLYDSLLALSLRFPWGAVVVAAAALGVSYHLFDKYVTKGVVWGGRWGDQTFVQISIRLPRGSDLERTDELARSFEERLAALPEVDRFTTNVFGNGASITVTFPPELEHTYVPPAIKEHLVAYSLGFSGAEVRVYGYGPSFYGTGASLPNYSIQILGYNYEKVREIAEDLGNRLRRLSRVHEVDTNASGNYFERDRATEFVAEIRRDALNRYGMSVQEFVSRLQAAVRGQTGAALLRLGGEEVRFEVKLEGSREVDLRKLRETLVTGREGTSIRIGDVVTIEPREVMARIRREDQQYERTVAYEFRGPPRLGDRVREAVVAATALPPGYSIKAREEWRWSREERRQIYQVLAVSLALVFMVTAALFESLRQPLCVLLTVPMALTGVFLLFFYADATFTREAYIGVIMMGGVVVNNAILLVDHINRIRREESLPLEEAVRKGTLQRVRPILMTTATTVLGLLPLVLTSQGADSRIWNALAYALMGGLASSTFFVLTTTPAVYLLFEGPRGR